jgi:NADPH2:quinone reductase
VKAVLFHELGEPEVLKFEEVPDPLAGPDDLLVAVKAAGVNFSDAGKRRGLYLEPTPLPYCPGSEVAGTVVDMGANVSGFSVGDRVVGLLPSRSGGYAELAVLSARTAVVIPAALDYASAVAIPNQGATALNLLTTMARLAKGESVLVHAAAGGVGGLIIQLAKHLGAGTVIGLASSAAKRDHVLALGADAALDSTRQDWAGEVRALTRGAGVDIVLDSVGGDAFNASLDCLAPFGRIVCYGLASGLPHQVSPLRLMRPSQMVAGFHLDGIVNDGSRFASDLQFLVDMVVSGVLKPVIGKCFALEESVAAHQFIESRLSVGKLVIELSGKAA